MSRGPTSILIGALVVLLLALAAASAWAIPIEVTYDFASGGKGSKVEKGLAGIGFSAVTEGTRTAEIQPGLLPGAQDGAAGDAAIGLTVELTCGTAAAEVRSAPLDYFVRVGRFGEKGLPVRDGRFSWSGPAYDGHTSSGKLEVGGRFTRRGTIVTGTVIVSRAKATGAGGEALAGCHTGPGSGASPLRYRLVGEI